MTPRYFTYALIITALATVFSWTSMLSDDGDSGSGYRSGSGRYTGWGGHK